MAPYANNIRLNDPRTTILHYISPYVNENPEENVFMNDFETFLLEGARKNNHKNVVRFVELLRTNRGVAYRRREPINFGNSGHEDNQNEAPRPPTTNSKKPAVVGIRKQNPNKTDDVAVDERSNDQLPRLYDRYEEEATGATATKRNKLMNDVIVVDEPPYQYQIRQPRQRPTSRIAPSTTSRSVSKQSRGKGKANLQSDDNVERMDMETVPKDPKDLIKVKFEFPDNDSEQPREVRKRNYKR